MEDTAQTTSQSQEEQQLQQRPPALGRKRKPSPFLNKQQHLQSTLRCDYVLLWYERDPKSPPGQCPNFLTVGDPIPVSLSHHVFMQMAFGVLKDRLMSAPSRNKSVEVEKGVGKGDVTLESPSREAETQTSGTHDAAGSRNKKTPTLHEQDVVALFCFLWQYVSSMLQSQAEALHAFRRKNKNAPAPKTTVHMTKQQLRLQMVLEHGVDVRQFLGDGLLTSNAVSEAYCKRLMTGKVMEEEFLNQLSKPAGMAQTCSMM
ncbi:hypothetical protein BCY84_18338 [Trypanosoma cruzi cruzi]|nr:hypothetical protein TcBrA4_0103730 [Trypanosoma cruzi]PBJ70631.1 hypothetical protein BCY84_18338 [Trypanosoma cruzi cruzi]